MLRQLPLAPDIVAAIINGNNPPQLTAKKLMRVALEMPVWKRYLDRIIGSLGNNTWAYAGCGEDRMTHSDLVRVKVQGADILVAMRGSCFRVKYRKQEAPWLIAHGPDDPGATITLSEFRALAWAADNDKARELWLV